MSSETKEMEVKKVVVYVVLIVVIFSVGILTGYALKPTSKTEPINDIQNVNVENVEPQITEDKTEEIQNVGYIENPAYEYLVGAAAWQMSAEAHALMIQGFHIAEENVRDMAGYAEQNRNGYFWKEENGQKKLYLEGKRVCVVCDVDDTLVDGVHYTANILGKNGEWTNKAFTDFIQSEGCTALPGAVEFTNFCAQNGIAIFYVTNRYDQGYKLSEAGYGGQEGYVKADGTLIGSSTYDIFQKTMYDITIDSLELLGFPTNKKNSSNYYEDALLIVNDTKLNGSSKEGIRQTIANGGNLNTGERIAESAAYPETISLSSHHIAMLLGDDLNDISQIFSDSEDAIERISLTIDNMEKWGMQWIVFPNSVYGSAANYAAQYGYKLLFDRFDYTRQDNEVWGIYK